MSVSPFLDIKNRLHTIAKITGSHMFYTGSVHSFLLGTLFPKKYEIRMEGDWRGVGLLAARVL